MDLFLANTLVLCFFGSALFWVKRQKWLRRRATGVQALWVFTVLIAGFLAATVSVAVALAVFLPPTYAKTFIYKGVVVFLIITLHWLWQAIKRQSAPR